MINHNFDFLRPAAFLYFFIFVKDRFQVLVIDRRQPGIFYTTWNRSLIFERRIRGDTAGLENCFFLPKNSEF